MRSRACAELIILGAYKIDRRASTDLFATMPGLIYVIGCDGPERYVGSTEQTLRLRWKGHRSKDNLCASKAIIDKYGPDACWIEALEEVSDDSLLLERERHWIDNTPGCINIAVPYRTPEEIEAAKEKRKSQMKAWAEAHPDSIREATKKCARKRRAENREAYNAYMRAYRAKLKAPPSV